MEFCSTKILKGKGAPKKTKWPKKFSMHRCQLSQQHVITFLATCTSLLHKLDSCISLQKKIGKKNLQFAMDFFLLQLGFAAKFRKIGLRAWFPWCPAPLTDIPFWHSRNWFLSVGASRMRPSSAGCVTPEAWWGYKKHRIMDSNMYVCIYIYVYKSQNVQIYTFVI